MQTSTSIYTGHLCNVTSKAITLADCKMLLGISKDNYQPYCFLVGIHSPHYIHYILASSLHLLLKLKIFQSTVANQKGVR